MCPLFQNFSDSKQEHNGTCSTEILTQYGYTDRSGIQNRYFDLAVKKCINALPDIFQGSCCRINCVQRIWQEKLSSKMIDHLGDQFLLIFCIQCSSGALQYLLGSFHILIMECSDTADNSLTAALIIHNRITGSLIYLGGSHSVKIFEIIQQSIRLLVTHSLLGKMNTKSSSCLMFNIKFHRKSPLYSAVSSVAASFVSSAASLNASSSAVSSAFSATSSTASSAAALSSLIPLASA